MRSIVPLLGALAAFVGAAASRAEEPPLFLQRGKELLKDPSLFVGRTVVVGEGFCFYDQPNFVCVGKNTPLEVRSSNMSAGAELTKIKDQCGGMDGTERNPVEQCAYSFRFKPTAFKYAIGDYFVGWNLKSNKRLIIFDTESIEPLAP